MIKPELYPTVIFRIPRFSYIDTLENNWNDLKECVKLSSPEFYSLIADMSYEVYLIAESKIHVTIRKYYNRARFRSTPYGTFSSVGIAKTDYNQSGIKLHEKYQTHSFDDWENKPNVNYTTRKFITAKVSFFTNSTFYCVGNEIRFIQKSGIDYQIAAVDYDETVLSILNICVVPRSFTYLREQIALEEKVLLRYLQSLLDVQLLLTSLHPNIIGEDYFARIGYNQKDADKSYLITERKCDSGKLDKKLFRYLPELVLKMQQVLEVNESAALNDFKDEFSQKFELAEIPIMIAIDPETGVGYGGLESHSGNILHELIQNNERRQTQAMNGRLKDVLFRKMQQKSAGNQTIDLNELIDLKQKAQPLPNSLHALCTIVDDKLYLDSLGGATATSLSARFASAIPEVYDYCKEISQLEQQCNPDVLFFDIGYTKEDHADNINRRPSIYDYQFNILNFDTSSAPITANDIMVSVHKGLVVLRSKSLQRRLIPRFSSAYNYDRSDLPIFRLLMDIQYQGIQSNLTLKPRAIIPDLYYYPRIQFQNIIVSPATWLIEKSLIKNISTTAEKCIVLLRYLRSLLHCTYIKTGSGDQTLLLNSNVDTDILILLSLLEKEGSIYVEETTLPQSPAVTDNRGRPYLPQTIVTLTHKTKIFGDLSFPINHGLSMEKKQWIAPGKDWIYFEIYSNPLRSDDLLLQKVTPFLKVYRQLLHSWFFIRYNNPSDHIRLRLRLKDQNKGYYLMGKLTELLQENLDEGTVSDIRICTYKKEVHRYSASLMEKVEEHFFKDSQYVLSMIKTMLSDYSKYYLCLDILECISESQLVKQQDFDLILKSISDTLKVEHGINSEGLKKINVMFREYTKENVPIQSRQAILYHQRLKESFINTIRACPEAIRGNLLANLMHMHINRIFATNQRLQELIVYEFCSMVRKQKSFSTNSLSSLKVS